MNITVVGMGKIGIKLVERLNREENHNITVIDEKPGVLSDVVNTYDVRGIVGSGASLEILTEAEVENTDVLISVTGSDEINLLTCLIARKLGKCNTIARVRNPHYKNEIQFFKEDLGLAMIINPEFTTASEIARALRFPSAIQVDTFAKGRIEILKFKIPSDSVLNDIKLCEMRQKISCDVLVCGVERGNQAFIPSGDFVLKAGDFISIVASIKNASDFIKKIGIKTNKVKDTTIVGGGTTTVYLANALIKAGIDVKIIEQNIHRCEELCTLVPKASIINGDGTENTLLLEEGIENAESFVALTNIDEENVLLSLYAKTKTDGKVITKINRISYDEVISNIGLDTIIYPNDIAAEYVVRYVRAMNNSLECNIETMHYILDEKAEALEFSINKNSPVSNKTIEELKLKENIIIASINRNGNVIIPNGKDSILTGDTVVVVTTNKGYKDIRDILR